MKGLTIVGITNRGMEIAKELENEMNIKSCWKT